MEQGTMTLEQQVEALMAENAKLKMARYATTTIRVGPKGGICVYGLGRYPVVLYKQQMLKFLSMADEIKAFIVEHDGELSQSKA